MEYANMALAMKHGILNLFVWRGRHSKRLSASVTVLLACSLAAASALAQYPSRPIRLISPFPPGGGVDTISRLVSQGLGARLGQPLVLENISGASGTMGLMAAARAAPDGYTLLFGSPSTVTIAENFSVDPNYNPARDLAPIGQVGSDSRVILVNPAVKATTLREFIALTRANPKKFFYGTPGHGHAFHLMTELFSREAGVEMTHVPYRGSGPAVVALLAGDIQFLVQSTVSVRGQLRDGRLRAIATLESSRMETLPELPTLAETGMNNLNIVSWYGVFAPARVPRDILDRLEKELLALPNEPGFIPKMKEVGYEPVVTGSQELGRILDLERQRWRSVIQAAGVKATID